MGAFVLGILVGWLAEWLFFTFWVKGKSDGDCVALKDEVAILKSKLTRTEKELKEATTAADKSSGSSTAQKATSSASSSKPATPKTSSATKATKSKASASTSGTKSTAKSTPVKKAPAKKAAAGVAASKGAKKAVAKKPATQAKKATSKKPAAPKKTGAKASKAVGDDFTKLSGIGPSMSSTLKELGIDTYEKLAAMDDDILRDMLEASGARLNNNKEAMDSWNEQATIAAKGDFEELKKFQETLKK